MGCHVDTTRGTTYLTVLTVLDSVRTRTWRVDTCLTVLDTCLTVLNCTHCTRLGTDTHLACRHAPGVSTCACPCSTVPNCTRLGTDTHLACQRTGVFHLHRVGGRLRAKGRGSCRHTRRTTHCESCGQRPTRRVTGMSWCERTTVKHGDM